MVNVSAYPISVDGVRLDTLAWGIESSQLRLGALRSGDAVLSGVDGVVPSLEDAREPSTLALSMFVRGTDADGLIPGGRQAQSVLRENLDELLYLFGRTSGLLDVREVVTETGTERQALCKMLDALEPELETGALARFTVSLTVPECSWRDVATQDWTQNPITSGTTYAVSTLAGSSAPVDDAVLLVKGPVTNPRISDPFTGAYVQHAGTISATEFWRVDVGAWQSRKGTTLGLGSAPTTGTDLAGSTIQGGASPRLLRLSPERFSGARRVRLSLTGTGITTATALSARTRRAYL